LASAVVGASVVCTEAVLVESSDDSTSVALRAAYLPIDQEAMGSGAVSMYVCLYNRFIQNIITKKSLPVGDLVVVEEQHFQDEVCGVCAYFVS
jgi:hypothetical protein